MNEDFAKSTLNQKRVFSLSESDIEDIHSDVVVGMELTELQNKYGLEKIEEYYIMTSNSMQEIISRTIMEYVDIENIPDFGYQDASELAKLLTSRIKEDAIHNII